MRQTFWSIYGRFVWAKYQPAWKQQQIARVVDALTAQSRSTSERVLDSGCGTGEYAVSLADAGFDVVGIDFAPGMLLHASKKVTPERKERLALHQVDLEKKLPFRGGEFDHVINISVLQSTEKPRHVLAELLRVLKPGGTLYLLHVPKPEAHSLPFRENMSRLTGNIKTKDPMRNALIATKLWAERTKGGRYWSLREVKTMVAETGFEIFEQQEIPVIVVHARKPN